MGIEHEGGSDTELQNIYITGFKEGSPTDNTQLRIGDQIIMCGKKCLIGVTNVEAWDILREAPLTVEVVVSRKKESLGLNFKGSASDLTQIIPSENLTMSRSRQHSSSSSLHFSGITPSQSFQGSLQGSSSVEDIREDGQSQEQSMPLQPLLINEETFTIVLRRDSDQPWGFSIKGGVNNQKLPHVYVSLPLSILL